MDAQNWGLGVGGSNPLAPTGPESRKPLGTFRFLWPLIAAKSSAARSGFQLVVGTRSPRLSAFERVDSFLWTIARSARWKSCARNRPKAQASSRPTSASVALGGRCELSSVAEGRPNAGGKWSARPGGGRRRVTSVVRRRAKRNPAALSTCSSNRSDRWGSGAPGVPRSRGARVRLGY